MRATKNLAASTLWFMGGLLMRSPGPLRSDRLAGLNQAVRRGEFLVHGSPVKIEGPILPGNGCGLVYATDNILFALIHVLQKTWFQGPVKRLSRQSCHPPVHGGLYHFNHPSAAGRELCFVSLHEALKELICIDEKIYLHACRPEGFRPRLQGAVTRLTRGKIQSTVEWVSSNPVKAEFVLEASLRDFDCPVALHRTGATHAKALMNYRMAAKVG